MCLEYSDIIFYAKIDSIMKSKSMINSTDPISVIIPVYNENKIIKECLNALLPQLLENDEIIIVDNNSTDNTVSIIQELNHPQIHIITELRQGITYARAAGFDIAKNPIIARIDADTVVSNHWLSVIRRELTVPSSTDALSGAVAIRELSPHNRVWFCWYFRLFRFWHQHSLKLKPVMYGHNSALKRELWQKVRDQISLGDNNISEDLDVTFACMTNGATIHYSSKLLVKCRVLRTTISLKKLRQYYTTDNYTLNKYHIGNKRRWRKQT